MYVCSSVHSFIDATSGRPSMIVLHRQGKTARMITNFLRLNSSTIVGYVFVE